MHSHCLLVAGDRPESSRTAIVVTEGRDLIDSHALAALGELQYRIAGHSCHYGINHSVVNDAGAVLLQLHIDDPTISGDGVIDDADERL